MRLISNIIFLFLIISAPILGEKTHLMLYFDINKTLIASDRVGGQSIEDVLNQLLASKYKYRWHSSLSKPISYDAYIRNILLPGDEHDLTLKKQRKTYQNHFISDLKDRNHPLYLEALKTYNSAHEKLKKSNGNVFYSFYRLLEMLDQKHISYTLILRSFGAEVFEIADEINEIYDNKFSHTGFFLEGKLFVDNEIVGNNAFEIYDFLKNSNHIAIRDDWKNWMNGKMDSQFGKPFIIDPADKNTLNLFFDDNIDLSDNKKNIISPIHAKTGRPILIGELADRKQVISVDTLEAILNENYFINLVDEALLLAQ